ncbi:MAG TPA: dihydroorotate dehydrogenase electron transfer subunit [Clostridiales bacterium]|jgi:dihydroorotate dehydrogenase electron transfer subunit|nr:dihydroorotate dehydrogenase electron transfer subunit [Clostridiales bacterium]
MPVILQNSHVSPEVCLMTIKGLTGKAGQFYMLRPTKVLDPLLGRPISIHDCVDGNCSFLYRIAGKGTSLMSELRAGDTIEAYGPYGNGFEPVDSDIRLIGGGIGIAPLYFLARTQKALYPNRVIEAYLGFVEKPFMVQYFRAVADFVYVRVGGYITSDVPFEENVVNYACGPVPMMKAAKEEAEKKGSTLYLSLEAHMACGVGACLGCTCPTVSGNKRVCKDGPVFLASEVCFE